MTRRVVGPFNRVEGDLEVALDIVDGRVRSAEVSSSLYRGFENMLIGREPLDALVLVPRICGICSVAQSAAAAAALADAVGLVMPANGRHAQNLILAAENLADHLTHFYCFFMPDFAREAYAGQPWHAALAARFRAQRGTALSDFLPARNGLMRVLGYLAGKWPHSLALQPGGTTRAITATEKVRLAAVLREFRAFLETTLFADTLENIAALPSRTALAAWAESHDGDFARFLRAATDLGLERVGRAGDQFLSFGAYPDPSGQLHLPAGVFADGAAAALDLSAIREDVRHAWLAGDAPLAPAGRRLHLVQGAALRRARARDRRAGAPAARRPAAGRRFRRRRGRQRHCARRAAPGRGGTPADGDGRLAGGDRAGRTVLRAVEHPGVGAGRRPRRGGARRPRPLAARRARAHRQLPDHRPDHVEFLAARCRRPARPPRAGADRTAGGRRRARRRARAACRPLLRPMHGVHRPLRIR
jgi:hypothetical protein